jgi:hypothetical protein
MLPECLIDIAESLDVSGRMCPSSDMAWRWLQSHSGQLRQKTEAWGTPDWYARRARLRAVVFDAQDAERWAHEPAVAASVATGVLADVREDAIVLDGSRGTEFFALSAATVTWLGAPASPAALRPGDPLVIRHRTPDADAPGLRLAERIWARIGRVTGTIIEADACEIFVDVHGQGKQRVVIAPAAWRPIQVRFPRLAPGFLLDVIGTRHGDYLLAVVPATSQPPYHAGHSPRPMAGGPVTMPVNGSAVWHEPGGEPPDLLGLGYPAIDAADGTRPAGGAGCVRLPYLSLGSAVRIRNECSGRTALLPVTSEGVAAREFCDRCLKCGTSPKGRVADLTTAAFVELGGNLDEGCFNATLTTLPG